MDEQARLMAQYAGSLDETKLEIVVRRAIAFGFEAGDLDDAIQLAIIKLQSFQYVPESRISEACTVAVWADHAFLNFRRGEKRITDRQEKYAQLQPRVTRDSNPNLSADVRGAIATLSEFDQKVCALIGAGVKKRELKTQLNCTQADLWNTMLNVRQRFIELGINEWIYEDQTHG